MCPGPQHAARGEVHMSTQMTSQTISAERTPGSMSAHPSDEPLGVGLFKSTIVCADDDSAALERLRLMLTPEGYEVLARGSTSATLECMWERLPDLLIIDPMMACMGGYQLCPQLRSHPETERIPIVFHTTLSPPAEKGLYDCICAKPAERSILLLAIRTLLMAGP